MKIQIISLGLIIFTVIIIIWGIVKIHTYPSKIAAERNHPQKDAIEVTSLLGLLVFPLWMFALIWAYSGAIFGSMYLPSAPGSIKGIDKSKNHSQTLDKK
jgi:uncharacterized membrane protein